MKCSTPIPALLLVALSACAASPASPEAKPARDQARNEQWRDGAPTPELEADESAVAVEAAAPAQEAAFERGTRLPADELALWIDPSFRRRFVESYAAETDIEPTLTLDERETMEEVLERISADEPDAAARILRKERQKTPSAVFDFTLANLSFQKEELEQAAQLYGAAIEKFPKFRRAWKNLALIHVRQGSYAEALPALTRVIELGGADALTYGLLGFSYSSVENELPAESAYRMAILLDPATMDWSMGLARSLFRQERYADAAALCGSLIAGHPDRADLWLLQANAYIGLGRPAKAAENYELVDRLGGSTADSLNMLADIYVNEEVFDPAVEAYARALEKAPGSRPERALRAAKVLISYGALQETERLLERVEELRGETLDEGERKDLLRLRARVAVARGAGDEEARVLEEIVSLDPLDGDALILLGQHAGRTGEPEKAAFYFERAAGVEGFEADAKVRHAQLLVGQGKYDEALPLLRRAQAIEPRENIQGYLEQVEKVAQSR